MIKATGKISQAFRMGGQYQVGVEAASAVFAQLPTFPHTVRVGCDGGLLSHLTVWKNLSLPLEYHALDVRRLGQDALLIFGLCGEDAAFVSGLFERYPDALSSYEKRLVGFVRALLLEPEVLVLENVFDGLSAKEYEKALHWKEIFRLRFPFRILLVLEQGDVMPGQIGYAI